MVKIRTAEKARRRDRVIELLAFKTPQQVINDIQVEFGVRRWTARRYVSEAQEQILQMTDVPRVEWIAHTLHQLEVIIRTGEIKDRLAALAQRTSLLGLQAPSVHVILGGGVYHGPEQLKAISDPVLREKALALEVAFAAGGDLDGDSQGNGREAAPRESGPLAEYAWAAHHPRLPAPSPPPGASEGGAEFTPLR